MSISYKPIISIEQASKWLADPQVAFIDGSWHMPSSNRYAYDEWKSEHIPGACFFNIDEIADHETDLPHMMPNEKDMIKHLVRLNLITKTHFIVYDTLGLFSSARVWWMLQAFGLQNVYVLEGGLPAWKAAGLPTTQEASTTKTLSQAQNAIKLRPQAVLSKTDVENIIVSQSHQIVDARARERFEGKAPEPRPNVRSGHIPGSYNLPFAELIENGRLKSPDKIRAIFVDTGIDLRKPIATTCGSGVTAAILNLALYTIGIQNTPLYDGSWSEWGITTT
jgi:thiosulfate/3-mercaptopyruvate sulfurtransferase